MLPAACPSPPWSPASSGDGVCRGGSLPPCTGSPAGQNSCCCCTFPFHCRSRGPGAAFLQSAKSSFPAEDIPAAAGWAKEGTHPPGHREKSWAGVAARAGEGAVEKRICLWPCFMLAACMEGYHLSSVLKSLLYTLPLGNQSHFVIHGVWHLQALFFYQTLVGRGNLGQVGSFREHQPLQLKTSSLYLLF